MRPWSLLRSWTCFPYMYVVLSLCPWNSAWILIPILHRAGMQKPVLRWCQGEQQSNDNDAWILTQHFFQLWTLEHGCIVHVPQSHCVRTKWLWKKNFFKQRERHSKRAAWSDLSQAYYSWCEFQQHSDNWVMCVCVFLLRVYVFTSPSPLHIPLIFAFIYSPCSTSSHYHQ